MEFDRSDLAVLAATRHLGVAMGRLNLVQDWIKSGELIIPFTNMTVPCEHCYFTSTISERQWPKILAFKQWIMKISLWSDGQRVSALLWGNKKMQRAGVEPAGL